MTQTPPDAEIHCMQCGAVNEIWGKVPLTVKCGKCFKTMTTVPAPPVAPAPEMPGNILGKEELWNIKREVARRYRTVAQTIERGGEAPKAYGNWARPTMESLLETCFGLYDRLDNSKAPALTADVWHCEACSAGSGDIGEYREVCGNCFRKLAPIATAETAQDAKLPKCSWEYVGGEELAIFWESPYGHGKEKIASFWWPQHPVEATSEVERIFESFAERLATPPPQPAGMPRLVIADSDLCVKVDCGHSAKEHDANGECTHKGCFCGQFEMAAAPPPTGTPEQLLREAVVFLEMEPEYDTVGSDLWLWRQKVEAAAAPQASPPDPYARFAALAEEFRKQAHKSQHPTLTDLWDCAKKLDALIAELRGGK